MTEDTKLKNLNVDDKLKNVDDELKNLNINDKLRVLTIGDPHFKTNNTAEMKLLCIKTIELAKNIKPDFIVVLGDVLDKHEKIHVVPLSQSIEWLENLSNIAPLYVLIGNHDRPNNSDFLSNLHPYNGLKDNDNIYIVDDIMTYKNNNFKFLFVPYVPPGKFMEAISTKIDLDTIPEYTCIFAHQEFFGAKMGAIVSKVGDKWPLSHPLIISGHIHDYNIPQENIIYTGTPIQHAFGDSTSKTVSLYTFNDNKEKYIEERIDLGLPKKRIFYLSPQEVVAWNPPLNSLIKLVIKGTNAEIKATMKLSLIKDWSKMGIKIVYKPTDEYETMENNNSNIYNKDNTTYLHRLHEKIQNNNNIKFWYDRLFSTSLSS